MAQSENKQEMQQDLTEHTETSPTDVQGDLTKTQISGSDHATEPTEPVSDVTATDVATGETENTVSEESTDDVTLTDACGEENGLKIFGIITNSEPLPAWLR